MKFLSHCLIKFPTSKANISLGLIILFSFGIHMVSKCSDAMNPEYLIEILDKLEKGENITFTKYGDGEYFCMIGMQGHNCDGDSYHAWLGSRLKEALLSLSKKPNTYIGKWWVAETYDYCDSIAKMHNIKIPWAWYHLFINDDEALNFDYMYKFVKFMVNTQRKKILICNNMNKRLKNFFRADVYIEIPSANWSYNYNNVKNELQKHLQKDCVILISAGLCSKVLIDDITNDHEVTFIDLGSSFDLLARKKNTRGWTHSYESELKYYKDFISVNWD